METDMTLDTTATPPQQAAYHWNVTFVVKTDYDSTAAATHEIYRTVNDADDLVNVILHTSLDPRIVAFHYERRRAPDLSRAPKACTNCAEPYNQLPPQVHWHGNMCTGHLVFQCTRCGQQQTFPELSDGCR
jgi:hypothetical protein